jgi:putative tricarboxylic transport membrane protein
MRINDLVLGLASLGLGAGVIVMAAGFPSPPQQAFGPALFPTLLGAGLVACGLTFVIQWVTAGRHRRAFTLPPWADSVSATANVAGLLGAPVFYILTVEWLGFVLSAFVCLAVLLMLFHRRILVALVAAAIVAPLLHLIFTKLLLVPLPLGQLVQSIAW